ncbi:hypothetical protein EGW08_021790, partial [Elysia chlorotica]
MAGTGRRISQRKTTAVASRQSLHKPTRTREQDVSFVSSTPAVGGSLSKFQVLTSPIPSDAEESMTWISGDTIIFKTPKAPSPARTRRRTTMIFQGPLLTQSNSATVFSPPGVKTRSRRSSIYTSLKERELQVAGKAQGIVKIAEVHEKNPSSNNHSISKTKKGSTKKAKEITNAGLPAKSARNQNLKRKEKEPENKAPPVTKRVKKELVQSKPTEKEETPQGTVQASSVSINSEAQVCVESKVQ